MAGGTPAPQETPQKESPAAIRSGASQCALLVVGGDPRVLPYYRAAWQPRVTAGIAPCGSCLQQPTRTVTIGHGSPPFLQDDRPHECRDILGLAQPTRGCFEGDCRLGRGRRLASPLGSRP